MAFTTADLEAVQRAIAKGEKTVQFSDRATTYRSMEELMKAEAHIAAQLSGRSRQSLGVATKGFD